MMKNSTLIWTLAVCGLFAFNTTTSVAQSYTEGFDDITTLEADGWEIINNSDPVGSTDYFQGNPNVFVAFSGDSSSYIGANFNNTAGTGTISSWLITPVREFTNGDVFSFYTISSAGQWADRLEVRMSVNGESNDVGSAALEVGDFTILLEEINPDLGLDYPGEWTQYTVTISDLGAPTTGRIAFRYFVTNGGPSGTASDFIGIDEVEYTVASVGVNETFASLGLNVYPNPGNGVYNLKMDLQNYKNVTVEAVDLQGKIVYTKDMSNNENNIEAIDLSSVADGVYFLKVNADNNVDVIRVVKH